MAGRVSLKTDLRNAYTEVRESIQQLKQDKLVDRELYYGNLKVYLSVFPHNPRTYPGPISKILWYCIRNLPTVEFLNDSSICTHWASKLKLWKFRKYKKARRASSFLRKGRSRFRSYRPRFRRSRGYSRFKRTTRRYYGRRRRYYRR